jgi:hypothetical protein
VLYPVAGALDLVIVVLDLVSWRDVVRASPDCLDPVGFSVSDAIFVVAAQRKRL